MENFLVVGLGNPGEKYAHTRHNAGFDVVTILSEKTGIRLTKRKSRALVGEGVHAGKRIILAMPQTYMNLSGESVAPLMRWYKVQPQNLLVVYDDVDLPPGTIRVRPSGSAGTHNGMRSIIAVLGSTEFPRVRVGVGSPPPEWDLVDWVIGHYPTAEARKVAFDSFLIAADAALAVVAEGVEAGMRAFNRKTKRPPKEDA